LTAFSDRTQSGQWLCAHFEKLACWPAWLLVGLTAGVGFQLWVASVTYAQNAPEGYNAVKDVRVRVRLLFSMKTRPT
jgi:hypothetical protein